MKQNRQQDRVFSYLCVRLLLPTLQLWHVLKMTFLVGRLTIGLTSYFLSKLSHVQCATPQTPNNGSTFFPRCRSLCGKEKLRRICYVMQVLISNVFMMKYRDIYSVRLYRFMIFIWDMRRTAVHRKWSTLVVARLATTRLTILEVLFLLRSLVSYPIMTMKLQRNLSVIWYNHWLGQGRAKDRQPTLNCWNKSCRVLSAWCT